MMQIVLIFPSLRYKQEKTNLVDLKTQNSRVLHFKCKPLNQKTILLLEGSTIAKNKRPFTDGKFVKKCIITIVKTVCLGKTKLFSDISFSVRIVTERYENIKCKQEYCFGDLQFSH